MSQTSTERLRDYLAQLPPQSQALLMREFERSLERGEDVTAELNSELAPLADAYIKTIDNFEQRQRMLDHATRWRDMPAEERANARVGMKRFHRLSPEQQAQMRVLYNKTRDMKPQERREAFALFHAMRDMNAEQRQDLRNRWAKMSPEQRETWMREHAPRRHGHKGPQPKQ